MVQTINSMQNRNIESPSTGAMVFLEEQSTRKRFMSTTKERSDAFYLGSVCYSVGYPFQPLGGSEAFVPHRRGLIRTGGREYSYFRRFSCDASRGTRCSFLFAAFAVLREQKAEARRSPRAENCSFLGFAATRETRRASLGITQLCKAEGVSRRFIRTLPCHLLARHDLRDWVVKRSRVLLDTIISFKVVYFFFSRKGKELCFFGGYSGVSSVLRVCFGWIFLVRKSCDY